MYYDDFVKHGELMHFGIKGQKWGVRRYQNPDGSLTPEGKKRYLNSDGTFTKEGKELLFKKASESKNLWYGDNKNREKSYKANEQIKNAIKSSMTDSDKKLLKEKYDKWQELGKKLNSSKESKSFEDSKEYNSMLNEATKKTLDYIKKTKLDSNDEKLYYKVFDHFIYDKGLYDRYEKSYLNNNSVQKEYRKAFDDYIKTSEKITSNMLGDYSDISVSAIGYDYSSSKLYSYLSEVSGWYLPHS